MFDTTQKIDFSQDKGTSPPSVAAESFLATSGMSLKSTYFQYILAERPDIGFFEIHAENYLSKGGPAHFFLQQVREHYPITVHGVGMSIGGEQDIDKTHLERVARLVEQVQPEVFSEHLAWSSHDAFLNDLLPVAYDEQTLQRVCEHIDQVQSRLNRRILIENPSTYFEFHRSTMTEIEFLTRMSKQTGCGLLLDINNVEVSCFNHQHNPYEYLQAFPSHAVGQMHLAGHTLDTNDVVPLKIDSHDEAVSQDVWALYEYALSLTGDCPTLIERDGNFPAISELLAEVQRANQTRAMVQASQYSEALCEQRI